MKIYTHTTFDYYFYAYFVFHKHDVCLYGYRTRSSDRFYLISSDTFEIVDKGRENWIDCAKAYTIQNINKDVLLSSLNIKEVIGCSGDCINYNQFSYLLLQIEAYGSIISFEEYWKIAKRL